MSFVHDPEGLGIEVTLDGATFTLTADDGSFCLTEPYRNIKSITLQSGESIGWMCYLPDTTDSQSWDGSITYVELVIEKSEQAIGYAVIKIEKDDYYRFSGEVIKCVTFEGQKVTDAQLRQAIAEAKK